ncbi:MAG: M2 family metallopeptidase [Pseudomonadota bacterium]
MSRWIHSVLALSALTLACPASRDSSPATAPSPGETAATPTPTLAEAEFWMKEVEAELLTLKVAQERAMWVQATFITDDTDIIVADAQVALMKFVGEKAIEATRFDRLDLPAELKRKIELLKLELDLPAPSDPAQRQELADIATRMKSSYGKGTYCSPRHRGACLSLGELSRVLAESRDWDTLIDAWQGWRSVSIPMRQDFPRYVELANAGARELGFADLGALWRSRYDMPPEAFSAEVERLWQQMKPLYEQLHCMVRARLATRYGGDKVPADQPIPAHLLGNMWSQEWGGIYDLVAPPSQGSLDITKLLAAKKTDELGMVRQAEAFFSSLGLEKLPDTFWTRSMFTKPRDRDVVCHASAWDIDWKDDLRIKMCIERTADDFITIHHELGHNYYQRAYKDQPVLFTNGANDGFHEALGDTLALSVTPTYLRRIGLLDRDVPDSLDPMLRLALDKLAFIPFGLVVDTWRFDVFSGQVKPEQYNAHWWELRRRYQGLRSPVERSEADFDPGAKYHVAANVPYTRYFLALVLQFQFHRALCRAVGHQGPLHQCTIHDSKVAGQKLDAMMRMGASRPWPEALKALTGEDTMDASAVIDYFKPLLDWLAEQNKDQKCGW